MTPWDVTFESRCRALVERVVNEKDRRSQQAAWKELLVAVSPHIETWAGQSRLLRRWRLTSPDEPRDVLLLAIERLLRSDHANLRAFLARPQSRPPRATPNSDTASVADAVAQLSTLLEMADAEEPAPSSGDDLSQTPFRAWLRGLVDFAIRDHLYARVGRADGKLAEQGGTKRDMHSEAKPFEAEDGGASRPPMTDALTIRRVAETVARYAEERLTPEQWRAVQMKRDDASFEEIADAMKLPSAEAAKRLVRSGIERLRAHFQEQWRELTGS